MQKRLAFFVEPTEQDVSKVPAGRDDLQLLELDLADPQDEVWRKLQSAHGYQALTRTHSTHSKTGAQWLPGAALIKRCPNLLAVCVSGAGYDIVDVEACTAAGIIVCNQSGAGKEAVAEHAFGFMIALSKKIGLADRVIRRTGDWDRNLFKGNDVLGKTVGIIGFGQIGSRLAELCKVFDMPVLAYDPYLSAAQVAERGGTKVELDELLARSDFVSLNGPLTRESEGMFGRAQFRRMKPTAFFITTARGGVHDEAALVKALKEGRIAGAGIDVFPQEPPPPANPLFKLDNVLVSPHTAGITVETSRSLAAAAAAQWLTIFEGGKAPRVVNPEAWPRYRDRFQEALGLRPPE